jgi:hypothetical protein
MALGARSRDVVSRFVHHVSATIAAASAMDWSARSS